MSKPKTPNRVRSSEIVLPQRGDRYMHHTGYTLTVVSVDGSMTNVQTSAGSIIQIPTGTLMAYPKMRQNVGISSSDK